MRVKAILKNLPGSAQDERGRPTGRPILTTPNYGRVAIAGLRTLGAYGGARPPFRLPPLAGGALRPENRGALAGCSQKGTTPPWQASDSRLLKTHTYPFPSAAWTALPARGSVTPHVGERRILRLALVPRVKSWRTAGSRMWALAELAQLAISPDGKRLASVAHEGTLKIWDLKTGAEVLTLPVTTRARNRVRSTFGPFCLERKCLQLIRGGYGECHCGREPSEPEVSPEKPGTESEKHALSFSCVGAGRPARMERFTFESRQTRAFPPHDLPPGD